MDDVVIANLAAMDLLGNPCAYDVYNVSTGIETNVVELYEEIAFHYNDEKPTHGPAKEGEVPHCSIDSFKLRAAYHCKLRGKWNPLEFDEGIRRTVAWFKDQ